jgi:hypothetical protein
MDTLEEYRAFLAEVRRLTGLDMLVPDDGGLVTVRVDDKYNLSLQYIAGPGRVLCFIEVAELPADAPKSVYRDLLAGGLFGNETAGGYFTLEPESETVIYNYFFDGGAAARDPEGFASTLENILQVCELWDERIRSGMEDASGVQPAPMHGPYSHGAFFA